MLIRHIRGRAHALCLCTPKVPLPCLDVILLILFLFVDLSMADDNVQPYTASAAAYDNLSLVHIGFYLDKIRSMLSFQK